MQIGSILAASALVAFALASNTAAAETEPQRLAEPQKTALAVRIDPHGRASGVILSDGTELVGTLDANLARVAVPGDPVRVEQGAGDRLVLTNTRTKEAAAIGPRADVDLEPLVPAPVALPIGGGPPSEIEAGKTPNAVLIDNAAPLERLAIEGRVALVLKAPNGAPAGLLMDDGTQVHVIPRVTGELARFHPGDRLRIEGRGTRGPKSSAMWALSITSGRFVYLDVERGVGAPEIGVGSTSFASP